MVGCSCFKTKKGNLERDECQYILWKHFMRQCRKNFIWVSFSWVSSPEAVFREKRGVWDHILELTLCHRRLRSQLSITTTNGKGLAGKRLSYWLNIFLSEQPIGKGRVRGRGRERVRVDSCLKIYIFGSWTTPCLSWLWPHFISDFNSSKRAKILVSELLIIAMSSFRFIFKLLCKYF